MYAQEFSKLWYKLSRDMKTHLEAELGPGLTEAQLLVLEQLLPDNPMKPSDLIPLLATTPAAVTTLLDRMERGGLIERVRDDKDRRIVWIKVTDKGRQEGERGLAIRQQFIESYLNRISSHNQQFLVYLLGKVANV